MSNRANSVTLGLRTAVERFGLILLLLILFLIFSFNDRTGDAFTSAANIQNILGNQSITGILAIAMVIPLVCDAMDLSVPAVAGVANVTFASLIGTHGQPIFLGIVVAMAISITIGCINGVLVAFFGVSSFIVTLGVFTLLGALLQAYTGGRFINQNMPSSLSDWGSGIILGVPTSIIPLVVVAVLAWYVLMHTAFGRELESIGDNPVAARLVGLPIRKSIFTSLLVSSALAGFAGILLTARLGGADPTAGPSYLFPAFAAVFLSATVFRVGRYNVWGAVAGVFLTAVAVNGIALYGAAGWVTPAFNGAALIIAVTGSTLASRRGRSRIEDKPHPSTDAELESQEMSAAR
jgi:ribose transport system permease protein